jgi:uncharacterized membrane protein YhaH (DUF805 family)
VFNIGPQEMFILMLATSFVGVLVLLPWYRIVTKAGFSGWWCLVFVVPLVNVVALYYIAFAEWPALRGGPGTPRP